MYRMSKRSKAIRILLLPVWLCIFLTGLPLLGLTYTFDYLWQRIDMIRDKFEAWVNKIAPLKVHEEEDDKG